MRATAAIVLGLIIASPALAQDGAFEQFSSAAGTFMQNLGPGDMAEGRYYEAVAKGVAGHWAARPMLGNPSGAADFAAALDAACATAPTTVSTDMPLSLTVGDGVGERASSTTYAYVGGVSFAPLIDLGALLKRQGAATGRADLGQIANATERVAIYRPSPDVLVIAHAMGEPSILVRCGSAIAAPAPLQPQPATTPAPVTTASVPDAALAEALGRSFDQQFKQASPNVRSRFIACATSAMTGLNASDLKILVDSNFNPGPAELTRIQDAYPAVSEGARACALEAQQAQAQ